MEVTLPSKNQSKVIMLVCISIVLSPVKFEIIMLRTDNTYEYFTREIIWIFAGGNIILDFKLCDVEGGLWKFERGSLKNITGGLIWYGP